MMAEVNGFFETAQEGIGKIGGAGAFENLAVAFQGFRVNGNIPPAAAGVRAVFVDAMEVMVIGWEVIGHGWGVLSEGGYKIRKSCRAVTDSIILPV